MLRHRTFRRSLAGLVGTGRSIVVVYRYAGKLHVVPPDDRLLGVQRGEYPDNSHNQARLSAWFRENPSFLLAFCNFPPPAD